LRRDGNVGTMTGLQVGGNEVSCFDSRQEQTIFLFII